MLTRPTTVLEAGLDTIRATPAERGTLRQIVRRPAVDLRDIVASARLDTVEGVVGDTWRERGSRRMLDGSADPDAQVTLMNARLASLIGGTLEEAAVAGDQLYVDFDISERNLPAGSRIQVGAATLEVSPTPHTGCAKFSARFGADALRFVSTPEGRALRLRGMNARIVAGGTIRVGDLVRKA